MRDVDDGRRTSKSVEVVYCAHAYVRVTCERRAAQSRLAGENAHVRMPEIHTTPFLDREQIHISLEEEGTRVARHAFPPAALPSGGQ